MNLSESLLAVTQDSSPQKKGSSETGANDLDSHPPHRNATAKITISRQILMRNQTVDPLCLEDSYVLLMLNQRKSFIFEMDKETTACAVLW